MSRRLFKRLLTLLAIVALAIPAVHAENDSGASRKKLATYSVAFYNLENLFDTINNNGKYDFEFSPQGSHKWDGHKYRSKLNRLAYAISQLTTRLTPDGPAVIGVSEIENESVLNDLVAAEPIAERGLKVIHHDSPDVRGVDVGLLYNPRLFRPLKVTNHPLVLPERPNFKTRDQMCVLGLLGTKETGFSRVAVIVNHWPSRRGGEKESSWLREAAAALSKSIADSLYKIDPNIGVIIMGDLNDDPNNKSVAEVLGAVKDPKDVVPGGFYNPFWAKLDDGIGSYIYRGGWDLFDQIIVNSNLVDGACGAKFRDANVFNNKFLLQTDGQYKGYPLRTFSAGIWMDGYSDHLPTQIFLTREVETPHSNN